MKWQPIVEQKCNFYDWFRNKRLRSATFANSLGRRSFCSAVVDRYYPLPLCQEAVNFVLVKLASDVKCSETTHIRSPDLQARTAEVKPVKTRQKTWTFGDLCCPDLCPSVSRGSTYCSLPGEHQVCCADTAPPLLLQTSPASRRGRRGLAHPHHHLQRI